MPSAFSVTIFTPSRGARSFMNTLGLAASLVVTALYHLGFAEYREAGLAAPPLGNGVMTLGYLREREKVWEASRG
jgi:hypothetical protein